MITQEHLQELFYQNLGQFNFRNGNINLPSVEEELRKFLEGERISFSNSDLKKFSKKKFSLDSLVLEKGFGNGHINDEESLEDYGSDSDYWMFLRSRGFGVAISSFEIFDNSFVISQIQGWNVQCPNTGFEVGKEAWEYIGISDLFLDVFEDISRKSGMNKCFVLPYLENEYEEVRKNVHNVSYKKYDKPALKRGYEYDSERGVLVKELK
jgi:hypothetical protein